MSTSRFIACCRVSTDKQSRSGLGLGAQRAAVEAHIAGANGQVSAEFIGIESGRKRDRPQLAAALADARAHRAVLVITKLDRLARNVHIVSGGERRRVRRRRFADCEPTDRPCPCRGCREEEARMISARTKAARAAAKARAANAVKTGRAQVRAVDVLPFIEQARRAGAITHQQFADVLAVRGVPTPSSRGARWHPVQMARIVGRYL